MRRFLTVLAIFLGACVGDNGGVNISLAPIQHVPTISNLQVSPDSALYMENDGSVQVTAEVSYTDIAQDIETLHVGMSDGTSLQISVAALVDGASGVLTVTFPVTTADARGCTIEIWLVDRASQSSNRLTVVFSVIEHAPELLSVTLSPASAQHMEGGGSVVVTAEIEFRDVGQDIGTLWVRLPDGTTIDYDHDLAAETGSFTQDLTLSTQAVGTFTVEFWLVDNAVEESAVRSADFDVVVDAQTGDWTMRLNALPSALNDVVWTGSAFVAVGNDGAILTSADGVDWTSRASGTDVVLNAVAAYGAEVFAVGDETVLISTNHGETWSTTDKHFFAVNLTAVAVTSSQVVVSGFSYGLAAGITSVSEDRGDTWQFADFWYAIDLAFRNGLYVGALDPFFRDARAWVAVSADGASWNSIIIREEGPTLFTVVHDGHQFIVAGDDGAVFVSFDGLNWTQLQTPVMGVDYLCAAWSGLKLVLAGSSIGIASTDGGASWEIFKIDDDYESRGMAYGNGRFVSVGWASGANGGAIFTAE